MTEWPRPPPRCEDCEVPPVELPQPPPTQCPALYCVQWPLYCTVLCCTVPYCSHHNIAIHLPWVCSCSTSRTPIDQTLLTLTHGAVSVTSEGRDTCHENMPEWRHRDTSQLHLKIQSTNLQWMETGDWMVPTVSTRWADQVFSHPLCHGDLYFQWKSGSLSQDNRNIYTDGEEVQLAFIIVPRT